MGVVYRATELSLSRQVALNVVARDLSIEEELRTRFLREVRMAACLDHLNVLPCTRREVDGVLYLAMRLVEGESLAQVLEREGTLEPARALAIVTQVAEALVGRPPGRPRPSRRQARECPARARRDARARHRCDFGVPAALERATALTEDGWLRRLDHLRRPRADQRVRR